jgi:hypothetical protein
VGFEYIDQLAHKLRREYPGCSETIDRLVKQFHERGERGEFGDYLDTSSEFFDAVRRDCTPKRPYRSGKRDYKRAR